MHGAAVAEQTPDRSHSHGVLLVAASGFIFSFGALAFRSVAIATDWQYLFYRGVSVTLAMGVLLRLRHGAALGDRLRSAGWRHGLAGLVLGAMSMLFVTALARTTVAITLFMLAAAPFCAALLAWAILREKVRWTTWAAMLVALVGIAIMVGGRPDAGSAFGVLLAGGIPILMGCYSVLLRSVKRVEPAVPALVAGVATVVAAGLVSAAGPGLRVPLGDVALGFLGGGVLLGVGLPMLNAGHRSVPAAEVNLLLLIEVVLGPAWVWLAGAESPTGTVLVGGGVVLAAVVGMTLAADPGRFRNPRPPVA